MCRTIVRNEYDTDERSGNTVDAHTHVCDEYRRGPGSERRRHAGRSTTPYHIAHRELDQYEYLVALGHSDDRGNLYNSCVDAKSVRQRIADDTGPGEFAIGRLESFCMQTGRDRLHAHG